MNACCCLNTLNLGCVDTCNDFIKTGNVATATQLYKLRLEYLGTVLTIEAVINEGDEIMFPTDGLNESYEFEGFVTDGEGAVVSMVSGNVLYDCISFKTQKEFKLADAASS